MTASYWKILRAYGVRMTIDRALRIYFLGVLKCPDVFACFSSAALCAYKVWWHPCSFQRRSTSSKQNRSYAGMATTSLLTLSSTPKKSFFSSYTFCFVSLAPSSATPEPVGWSYCKVASWTKSSLSSKLIRASVPVRVTNTTFSVAFTPSKCGSL